MIENTRAGLDAARARGKKGGRPPKLDESKAAFARKLAEDRERPIKEICDLLHISHTTFYKYTASASTEPKESAEQA